jgi:hypothetical protein
VTQGEPFEELRLRQEAAEERHRCLTELGHQWDHTVRSELQRLAHALWPNGHALGLLPVHRVRLRHHVEGEAWAWWIERDIPPYDLYHCEAYRVTLALDAGNEPVLTVESGAGAYQVAPLTAAALEAALAQAGEDPPLVIPRAMGEVVD